MNGYGYFPALAEIIYALVILLSGAASVSLPLALLQAAVLLAFLSLLSFGVAPLVPSPRLRALLLATLLVMPDMVLMIERVGMVDLLIDALALGALLFLFRALYLREESAFLIASGLLGLALSMKLTMLVLAGYMALVVLIAFFRRYLGARSLALFFLVPGMLAGYWYLRSLIVFANPFYPLFSGAGLDTALAAETTFLPKTWWAFLFHPLLIYVPFLFPHPASRAIVLEALVAAGALLLFAFRALRAKRVEWDVAYFIGFALFYSWVLAPITDDIRHTLPAFLALLIALFLMTARMLPVQLPRAFFATAALLLLLIAVPVYNVYKERALVELGREPAARYIANEVRGSYTPAAYESATGVPLPSSP